MYLRVLRLTATLCCVAAVSLLSGPAASAQIVPSWPFGTIENIEQQLEQTAAAFLAEPQLVARVRTRADLAEQVEAAFQQEQPNTLSGAPAITGFRTIRQLPNGESIITFELTTTGTMEETANRIQRATDELRARVNIVWIEPVQRDYFLTATSNDPFFSSSGAWGQSYFDLWGLYNINAPLAWDTTTGDADLILAVVDTGIDYTHPDLFANIWVNPAEVADVNLDGRVDIFDIDINGDFQLSGAELSAVSNGVDDGFAGHTPNGYVDDFFGYDFRDEDSNPRDFHGHGTHVAGTIGATGNNGIGVVGVNWQCKLLAANGFNGDATATSLALAESIMYAADAGARAINCSWGSRARAQVVLDAMDYAAAAGSVVVHSSGNSSIDSVFLHPRNTRGFTVNASNEQDGFTTFSNFGIRTDVAAPGGGMTDNPLESRNILSTLASASFLGGGSFAPFHVATEYARLAGTSMATPHVVGTLGLIFANNPALSIEAARQALRFSASDQGDPGWDPLFGYGRLDAAAALQVTDPCECRILEPAPNSRRDQFPDPTAIEIVGFARNANDPMTSYRLDYRDMEDTSWIEITPWTNNAINEGILATWDASALSEGRYMIRLQVQDSQSRVFEDRTVFSIPSPPMPGWPFAMQGLPSNFSGPVIDDTDNDGVAEIITCTTETLFVLDGLAQSKPGFPWNAVDIGGGSFEGAPVVGEFDPNYPGREIVVARRDGSLLLVDVFHADGSRRMDQNWPLSTPSIGSSGSRLAPALADLDQDGDLELVIYGFSRIRVFDNTGLEVTPPLLGAEDVTFTSNGGKMAVGDITGDGFPEIVFNRRLTADDHDILAYDFNDQKVLEVNINTLLTPLVVDLPDRFALGALCLANLDADPEFEIIGLISNQEQAAGSNLYPFRDQEVIALNGDGTLVPGAWPVHVAESGNAQLYPNILSYVCAADLDSDGVNEVIATSLNSVTVLRADGSDFGSIFPGVEIECPLVVGDLDGDPSTQEIVAKSLLGEVYGFATDGSQVDGFPLGIHGDDIFLTAAPALGDIDGDGLLELVVKEPALAFPTPPSFLVAYDVNGQPGAHWPMDRATPEGRNALESCPPRNDTCDAAFVLIEGTTFGTLTCSTNQGMSNCDAASAGGDLWYRYQAPCVGVLTVDTCGSHDSGGVDTGPDTILSVYSQCPGLIVDELDCNDDWQAGAAASACSSSDTGVAGDAAISLALGDAEEVWIRISHTGSSPAGSFVLNVDFDCDCEDPANLACNVLGDDIELTWTNNESYDSITVFRDGMVLTTIAPATESYLDVAPPNSSHSYSIQGTCGGIDTHLIPAVECSLGQQFERGDCNGDGGIDIADAIRLLAILFPTGPLVTTDCEDACDANDDGSMDIADAIRVLSALFGSQTTPLEPPYPDCGLDPTPSDSLDCSTSLACP